MKYSMNSSKFVEDKTGKLWFSASVDFATRKGGGLWEFDGKEWTKINPEKYHTEILEDSKGNLWCTGMRGAYMLKNDKWELQRKLTAFATFYFDMYEDKKGNIWFGTSTVGGYIEKYSPK